MKLKATVVAMAVALGWAGQASATLSDASTGNSVVLFSAWNPTTGASYTLGLGLSFNDFTPALASSVSKSINLLADPNFTAAFGTSLPTDLVWNVAAGDQTLGDTGTAGAGLFRLAFTAPAVPTSTQVTIPNVTSAGANMNFFLGAVNAACPTLGSNSGSCFSTLATDAYNINNTAAKWGSTLGGILGISTSGGVGSTLSFVQLATSQTGGKGSPTITSFGVDPLVWKLSSDGQLTWNVAAIPEPSSWLLLGAGLLAIGSIARRRLS
jgi:hypothetical protein